jgi:hypothetical protein
MQRTITCCIRQLADANSLWLTVHAFVVQRIRFDPVSVIAPELAEGPALALLGQKPPFHNCFHAADFADFS